MTATATALAVPRALTPPERAKLRALLKAQLKIATDDDADDAEELLDYALEMVEGGKAAGHVAEELLFMEMPVCGEAEAAKVGETLAAFFASLENDSKDDAAAALQERLARLREKKSERLASVQKGRQASSVRDRIAGLEEGKAKKGGGVSGVPKTKEGEQAPAAGLEKGKGKDDEGVLVGEKKEEERDALPPASSMTVVELKEELRARNDSGYVPHSRLALEAALAAARKKDGTSDTKQVLDPGARLKGGADVDEENGGGEGKGKVAAATSLGRDRGVEGGASVADGRLGAGDIGDVEEGKRSAAVQAASSAGGQGAPAVSAAVHPNMRHHYRAASDAQGSGAHGNDGKGLGVAILVLLLISFGLAFAKPPEPTCRHVGNTFSRYEICTQTAFIAPYIAGACLILALILTSSLTCHCCCAAGIELEDRAKKFITAALLAIVTMFVLGVVGAFVLSSNGMAITSGVTALGVISLVLNVAAMISVALFVWGRDCRGCAGGGASRISGVSDGNSVWRQGCWSDWRSKRRTIILAGTAFALLLVVAIPLGVVFGTKSEDAEVEAVGGGSPSPTPPPTRESKFVYGGKNSDDQSQSFDWTPELVRSIVAPVGLPKFQDAFSDETSPQARAVDWLSNGGGADIVTGPSLEAVEWRIQQRYALAVMYYATGGEEWKNQYGYLDSDKHECEWGGGEQLNNGWKSTDCADGDGRVTLINLWQNNLRGTLPVELASLSGSLTAIDLLTNQIEGTIPEELFRMKKLNYLNLGYNKFSGTVSAALGDLDQLTYLMLDNNEMTGTIPSELGKLTQLSGWLSLEGNRLRGTVPESFQDLTKAMWIYLNYNDLTGSIEFLCDALKPVEAPGGANADASSPLLELWADVDEVECSCCNCCPIVEEEDPELVKPVEQGGVGG